MSKRSATQREAIDHKYEIKQKLERVYGCSCYYCGIILPLNRLTLDHIFPVSVDWAMRGRRPKKWYTYGNSILSCKPCNQRKGNRVISIEDFRKEVMGDRYEPHGVQKKTHLRAVKHQKKYANNEAKKKIPHMMEVLEKSYRAQKALEDFNKRAAMREQIRAAIPKEVIFVRPTDKEYQSLRPVVVSKSVFQVFVIRLRRHLRRSYKRFFGLVRKTLQRHTPVSDKE